MPSYKDMVYSYVDLENQAYLAELKAEYLHQQAEAAAMALRVRKQRQSTQSSGSVVSS